MKSGHQGGDNNQGAECAEVTGVPDLCYSAQDF